MIFLTSGQTKNESLHKLGQQKLGHQKLGHQKLGQTKIRTNKNQEKQKL